MEEQLEKMERFAFIPWKVSEHRLSSFTAANSISEGYGRSGLGSGPLYVVGGSMTCAVSASAGGQCLSLSLTWRVGPPFPGSRMEG